MFIYQRVLFNVHSQRNILGTHYRCMTHPQVPQIQLLQLVVLIHYRYHEIFKIINMVNIGHP